MDGSSKRETWNDCIPLLIFKKWEAYLKIEAIGLAKLNNAENTNFMNRTLNQAVAVGLKKME